MDDECDNETDEAGTSVLKRLFDEVMTLDLVSPNQRVSFAKALHPRAPAAHPVVAAATHWGPPFALAYCQAVWQLFLTFLKELPEPLLTFRGSAEIIFGEGGVEDEERGQENGFVQSSLPVSTDEGSFLGLASDLNTTVDLADDEEEGAGEAEEQDRQKAEESRDGGKVHTFLFPTLVKLEPLLARLPNAHGNTLLSLCEMLAQIAGDDEAMIDAIADQVGPVAIRLEDGDDARK